MSDYALRKEAILKDASELIQIESVTQDREKNREALNWVIKKSQRLGLKADFAIDGEVVVVTLGFGSWSTMDELRDRISKSGKETLGILAHVDVVPAEGCWTNPPFDGELREGCLCGRGTVDDKGPLVLCLHAVAELAASTKEAELKRNILMVVGSREEECWLDMEEFNKLGIQPDFGFTPDGEFPVSNREKGYLDIAFRFPRKAQDLLYILSGGSAVNVIPETAQLIIKNQGETKERSFESHGISTHSSKPENGENAIIMLAESLKEEPVSETVDRVLRFLRERCKDYYGSGLNLDSGETMADGEYFHRNVISPVRLNTTDEYYEIVSNMRSSWGYTGEKVAEELKPIGEEWGVEIQIIQSLDPTMISRDSEFLRTVEGVYEEITGEDFDFELAHGCSYAKAMPNIVAFGPSFPGVVDTCHEADEKIDVDEFMKAGEIYWGVISRMCSEYKIKGNEVEPK